jgi:hypothetical protein
MSNQWKNCTIIAISAVCLYACKPLDLQLLNPEGPPDYVEGFDDGCDSAVASGGGIMQRYIYGFNKNPDKLDNALYKMGWNEGWTYCRFTMNAPKTF